ncbi:hypothetical protein QE152_g39721 [Popillia japonica]|uniref:Uncharacterized protein n=1 Tax=Popillia japonica TaxID=7064 RepID=A0AAW1HTJ7_POPJA
MVFYDEFKRLKSLISDAYKKYISVVENDIKSDPSKLWKFLSDKRKSTGIPGQMIVNDSELNDPSEIVNSFAATFADGYSTREEFSLLEDYYHSLPFSFSTISEDVLTMLNWKCWAQV